MSNALEALTAQTLPSEQASMDGLIQRMTPAIERALPHAIGAERFTRLVLTTMRQNPKLYECRPETVLGALMLCAQLGLEPGPLGHAYLVPYKRECQFILGYKGKIELAGRSGRLRSIVARPVYEMEWDDFEHIEGTTERIKHKMLPPSERGSKIMCYYGIARLANPTGIHPQIVWPEQIEEARMRSPLGREGKGPWRNDPVPMALKTVINRMAPFLPQSVQYARGAAADESVIELTSDGEVEESVALDS